MNRVLRRAGVLDKVRAAGFEAADMCWRELGGKYVSDLLFALDYLSRLLPPSPLLQLIITLPKSDNLSRTRE